MDARGWVELVLAGSFLVWVLSHAVVRVVRAVKGSDRDDFWEES